MRQNHQKTGLLELSHSQPKLNQNQKKNNLIWIIHEIDSAYTNTHHHYAKHKLKVIKTQILKETKESFLGTSLTMDNCHCDICRIFVQRKYNNNNNTILRGFDTIELTWFNKKLVQKFINPSADILIITK